MKQKYLISKGDGGNTLVIKEFAEIDKEVFSILCEETYDMKTVCEALDSGMNQVSTVIRNRNFFPAFSSLEKISEGIKSLTDADSDETVEIFIDDADILSKKEEEYVGVIDDLESDSEQIDDLLEDELEDDAVDVYDDENLSIKKINASIKVDEDELIDDNGDI
jgi:hypothetical protein